MVDTLSQNEIDALLSALSPMDEDDDEGDSGSTPEPAAAAPVKAAAPAKKQKFTSEIVDDDDEEEGKGRKRVERKYDFKRQTKFSKEQLNTIQLIHESFARLVATDLSTRLRAIAQASIISVEQQTFEDLIRKIYSPTFITVLRSENLDGKMMIDMSLGVVFAILDRLLGGSGASLPMVRQLTEVEKQIMQKIMTNIVDRLREAWINIIDLAPVIELVESNPQFAQIVPPSEIVVSITIDVRVQDVQGNLTLCIPYNTVETIVHKFNAASWFAAVRKEPAQTNIESISTQVKAVHLPVVAELGTATVPLQDILNLQPGEILVTDQLFKNDLNIRVGNLVKFQGRPGIMGKKMAMVITQVLDPPDQEEESQ